MLSKYYHINININIYIIMGNICLHDDTKEMPVKKYCYKCGDYFKIDSGGYSHRRSCRFHNFENGTCIDCRSNKKTAQQGCYHVKSYNFWDFCQL